MKKTTTILTAIILASLLTSCGARKVNREKTETKTETKTEVKEVSKSIDSTKVETQENYSTKINIESFIKDFTFEPIDNTKPFFIGSQKYENVKVVNKETNSKYSEEVESFRSDLKQYYLVTNKIINTLKKENKELKSNTKQVDKKESFSGVIWGLSFLLLIILIIYIVYRIYIKNQLKY